MDREEAENLLRGLRASLSEFGSSAVFLPSHGIPEDGEPDVHSELAQIINEYEAILVVAPIMMGATMDLLQAKSISFIKDADDIRFRDSDGTVTTPEISRIKLSRDDLEEWTKIALQAKDVITELRRMLNDDAR